MKLTYLGTAAAEGFPAVFCNCRHCNEARRLGGKNIRTRSQALVNDDLLIDFPADTLCHFLNNGIQADKIKHLLITHTHADHFYARDIQRRRRPYAHDMRVPALDMVCSSVTAELLEKADSVEVKIVKPFDTVRLGDYEITALPARHMPGGEALFYIIRGDKTLLYAHDTGYFYDEVFEYIEKSGTVFDMISLDCTNVHIPIADTSGHMGFPNIERVLARLSSIGAINESTVKYINHFSHNGGPLQHLLEADAEKHGCHVSYDGCRVEF